METSNDMETTKRKVYLVYSGDDIPYEPVHVIASFLDKDKAEEFVEKLKEEDEKNRELEEQYTELYNQYYEYLEDEHIEDTDDNVIDEALAKKFGVTKEFAHEVMNFYYYPQIYYIGSTDLHE